MSRKPETQQTEEDLTILAEVVRSRRAELGLSQQNLADDTNTDQGTISRLENAQSGRTTPALVKRIAQRLGIQPKSIPYCFLWREARIDAREARERKIAPDNEALRRHVLLLVEGSQDDNLGYCKAIRNILTRQLEDEGIPVIDPLRLIAREEFKESYYQQMVSFTTEGKFGTLITVFPNENTARFNQTDIGVWARAIRENDQHLICIDSGYQFRDLDPSTHTSYLGPRNLTIIQARHKQSVFVMLDTLFDSAKTPQEKAHIEFVVTEADCGNTTLKQRHFEYSCFLSLLSSTLNKYESGQNEEQVEFEKLISNFRSDHRHKIWARIRGAFDRYNHTYTLNQVRVRPWTRDAAKTSIARYLQRHAVLAQPEKRQKRSLTVFLCDNDDVALGARDAVLESNPKHEVSGHDFVFLGFDGTQVFREACGSSNLAGITYAPNYASIAGIITTYVRNGRINVRDEDGEVLLDGEIWDS